MMNIYRYTFTVKCPNNDRTVDYTLEVTSVRTIMVEEIMEACKVEATYHEVLADSFFAKFGGKQIITAFHHGVWIETRRG